jgi:hypothetical protein
LSPVTGVITLQALHLTSKSAGRAGSTKQFVFLIKNISI